LSQRPPRKKRDPSEIGDALRNVGDEFVKRNPADIRALRLSLAKARRKRQLFFGGSVVAATAAIALLFVVAQRPGTNTRPVDVTEQPASPQTLRITSEITLDGQPFQVASNSEGAYVTLRDEGAVAKIDPEGKVRWIQTIGGAPEDIIAGEFAVWVTEPEEREIHALSFRRGVATQTPISVTKGIPQRLSVGRTSVRISTLDGPAYRINFDGREGQQLGSDTAWDIAYAAGRLWILTPEGLVYPIDAESGIPVEGFEPVSVFEAGEFELATAGEITAAHGGIWYGRPGDASLLRIDEGDGSTEEIALPDSYLDLDGDSQGGLWILTSSGDAGELIEVDDKTGELLPRSIALHDAPVDIAASGDGVWIVLAGSHEVLHVNDAVEGTL
jgi:streptogramin lyase